MANTQKYLNHLLQSTGITPACSEEERAAADIVADIFRDHGFQPEIQEFSASSSAKVAQAAMGIMVFVGAVLMGIGGAVGIVGVIIALAGAVLFVMERAGHPVLSNMGAGGLSQNVIAYHKASGPLASPRNRPVVVVAHYDSPRADLLSQEPYASYRPMLVKLLPFAMIAPAIMAVVRLLPIPGPAKIVLWVLAIVVSLIPLANSVAIIANKYVLPYTSGSVCNKSSVAAMLGVMDAVSPYQGANEFPGDIPFDQYMEEQRTYAPVMELIDEDAYGVDSEEEYDEPEDELYEEDHGEQNSDQEVAPAAEMEEDSDSAATAMWSALDAESVVAAGVEAARRANQAEASAVQPDVDLGSTVAMTSQQFAAALLDAGVQAEEPAESVQPVESYVPADQTTAFDVQASSEASARDEVSASALPINASGNIRYGVEVLRALGMVSASCAIEYEPGAAAVAPAPQPEPQQPVVPSDSRQQLGFQPADPVIEHDDVRAASGFEAVSEPDGSEVISDKDVEGQLAELPEDGRIQDEADSAACDEVPGDDDLEPQRVDQTSMWAVPAEFGGSSAYAEEDAVEQFEEDDDASPEESGDDIDFEQSVQPSSYLGYADVADDYILEAEYEIIDDEFYEDEVGDQVEDAAVAAEWQDDQPGDVDDDNEAQDAAADDDPDGDYDSSDEHPESEAVDSEDGAIKDASDEDAETGDESDGAAIDVEDANQDSLAEIIDDMESDGSDDSSEPELAEGEDGAVEVDAVESDVLSEEDEADSVVDVTADTQLFQMPEAVMNPGATQAMPMPAATERTVPSRPVETVDSLMAQISQPQPTVHIPPRAINVPDITVPANARRIPAVPGIEAFQKQNAAQNRSPLFDLPDPSVKPADPFVSASPSTTSAASRGFSVVSSTTNPAPASEEQPFDTIKAPAPQPKKQKRGLGGLFGRKKKQQDSMSEWLGVDDDFDAKRNGGEIGSWDNFDGDDNSWKGGAAGGDGVTELELRDAITSMGDDELLGHDIWFVATGASECGNAGLRAFLETHRDKLRGVFLINLESVGAGQIAMLSTEGDSKVLKGDKRIMKLVQRVSSDFHHEIGAVDMPYVNTDAHAAMSMSLRSLTIAGIDGSHFACSHSEDDMPYNVDERNVNTVADVVTEVIRRS